MLVDKVNEGTLDQQAVWDAMAGRLKLPAYDPTVAAQVVRLTLAAQDAKSVLDRQRAVQKLNDYIASQTGPTAAEYWTAIWYMRMLSGPWTHVVNTLSNAGQSAVAYAAAASRRPSSAFFLANAYLRGVWESVPAIAELMRTGRLTGPRLLKTGISAPLELPSNRPPGIIRSLDTLLRQWRLVGRLLGSEDLVFFSGLREMRAAQLAFEEARLAGLSGKAARDEAYRIMGSDEARMKWARDQAAQEGRTGMEAERRARELRDEYRGPEMQEDMVDYALRNTFNLPRPYGWLGGAARGIETFLKEVPAGRLQMPFTRILANVGNESLEWVGFWRPAWNLAQAAAKGRGGVTIYGKDRAPHVGDLWERGMKTVLAGSAIAGLIYAVNELLKQPAEKREWELFGPGPIGPTANKQWREMYGEKPFTLRIGKRIYNLNDMPMGAILAVAATYTDAIRYGDLNNQDTWVRFATILQGLGRAVLERSGLSQVRDFFGMMGEQGRSPSSTKTAQFFLRPLGGIASSRLAMWLDRVSDPTRYDITVGKGALLSQIPFARRLGKPDLNRWGRPIMAYTSERLVKDWDPTPLDVVLVDKQAWVADPSPIKLDPSEGPDFTDEENYEFVRRSGPEIFDRLNELLPQLRTMEPEAVREVVSHIATRINQRVKYEVLAERPQASP